MDIRIIIRMHEFIIMGITGSPKELAMKLSLSERTVYNYISYMKTEMNAPLEYIKTKKSYCYTRECKICFKG